MHNTYRLNYGDHRDRLIFNSHKQTLPCSNFDQVFAPFFWAMLCRSVQRWSPYIYKKLIRRWDSERELYLQRRCTHTKNTIDSCINSATYRFLQRRFTKFSEITQCNGHYAVQGHSRSPILVPIESSYTTSYFWLILTYFLSCTVSKLWLLIGQIFPNESGVSHFIALAGGDPCQYRHKWYIAKN